MDIQLNRKIYRESDLDKDRIVIEHGPKISFLSNFNKLINFKINFWTRFLKLFPIITWLPQYLWKSYLKHDIICGLTSGILYIPQALAYSNLSNLPSVTGLYMGFFSPLIYMVTGSSKYLSLGAFSIVAIMIGSAIDSGLPTKVIASGSNITKTQANYIVATTLTFMVGALQFGFLSNLISNTVTHGFVFGAAVLVVTSQLSYITGVNFKRPENVSVSQFAETYISFFRNITNFNYVEFLISIFSVGLSLLLRYLSTKTQKRFKLPLPSELIVIIVSDSFSYGFDFETQFKVRIVGPIPSGFPGFSPPRFSIMGDLISHTIAIAIVSYGCSVSLAKGLAEKNNDKIYYNTELFSYGLCNFVSSFFHCFVSSASISRSVLQASLGKTQLSSVVSCLLVLMVILFAAPLFTPLPLSTLSAIIIVALLNIFKGVDHLKKLYQISLFEFSLWIVTVSVTVFFGITYGLMTGLLLSLFKIIWQIIRPTTSSMEEIQDTGIFKEEKYFNLSQRTRIKILQFKDPLVFINKERLVKIAVTSLKNLRFENPEQKSFLILDGKYWSIVDMEGCMAIIKILMISAAEDVTCMLSNLSEETYQFILRKLAIEKLTANIFPTTLDAVHYANNCIISETGVATYTSSENNLEIDP
ncbi:Sulfate anion transporter 1 [Thelohanellus kitauei]|uniref:Sulfate anion transporter 1 n=1 Tax=Thelohanellus kitauei TaxID=669202 RepID=A0A0C2N4L4_THEKT|nr:Sulfate anion transporter 1 [Thelohanellus kitauei]